MFLGKVVGTVVSTQKDPKLSGLKLLLVQQISAETLKPRDLFHVVADAVGAGKGEIVVVVGGSSARITESTDKLPVDSSIIAIVDTLEMGGKNVYQKSEYQEPAGVS